MRARTSTASRVIAYELLAGARPIEGDGFMVLVDRHLNARPRPLGEHRPDLPAHVADAIMRGLEKDPDISPTKGSPPSPSTMVPLRTIKSYAIS